MVNPAVPKAATDIVALLVRSYRTGRGVHAETVIGAAAALAGEFALRAVEPALPERGWVASDKAAALLLDTETAGDAALWTVIQVGALKAGAAPGDLPDAKATLARTAKAVGGSPFPPLSVGDAHFPHEWSPGACPRLRGDVERIAEGHGLSAHKRAQAVAYAVAMLIAQTKDIVPPAITATLALEIMIGVAHMVPIKEPA